MEWGKLFYADQAPTYEGIKQFIGAGATIWLELMSYIEEAYKVEPKMTYSKCSAQPGWNVKYQKGGKSLCTLYPMDGYFISLVVIGGKEEEEVGLALETFTPYVQELYRKTRFSCGGRWLMIEVKDKLVLEDVKRIIGIRVKPKKSVGYKIL